MAVGLALLALLVFGGTLQAGQFSLDLVPQAPDIRATAITVTYDAQSTVNDVTIGRLLVEGLAREMDVDDVAPPNDFWTVPEDKLSLSGSPYTIDIMLEVDTGNETIEATSGTIKIEGYLVDWRSGGPVLVPGGTGTLLTGNEPIFGFTDGGIFEFLFESTGGDLTDLTYPVDLSPIFGPVGDCLGVILDPVEDAGGNPFSQFFDGLSTFTQDFCNKGGEGQSDTFVPEPSALVGLASLFLGALHMGWRRKRGTGLFPDTEA